MDESIINTYKAIEDKLPRLSEHSRVELAVAQAKADAIRTFGEDLATAIDGVAKALYRTGS